jgi:hypothetical protein
MNAERELRELVDERVRAVRERDSATLAAIRPTTSSPSTYCRH